MTEYYCRGYIRFIFVLILLVFCGAFLFFFLMPSQQATGFQSAGQRTVVLLPLGLLFGGMACAGFVGLLNTFTVFRLDENGILKRWWNGSTQEFAWKDLVRAEPTQDGSGNLTDFRGNRMSVPSTEFGYRSEAGRSLHEALAERLANLPDAVKARIEAPREFRFGQPAPAIAAGFMAVLCIVLAISVPLMPMSGPPPPLAFKIGLPAFCLFGALFMAYLGLQQATRVLLLTDTGLIDRSLFGKREIPFDQIVSVTTKDMQTKSGTMEVTTVKSAATTITIPSLLPNYDRLTAALHGKVGAQVTENAPQAIAEETKRFLMVNVIGLFVIGCLLGLAWAGIWLTALHDGQAALQRQAELDAHGKRATGEAIGVGETGSKSRSYSLNYSFQVDGRSYNHVSSVSREVYDNQQIGEAVQVDYLPNDPEVSRVTLSIAKENAKDKIRVAKMMIGFACGLPFLLGGLGFTQRPRYRAPSGRTSSR
jgi:hypothetical protein